MPKRLNCPFPGCTGGCTHCSVQWGALKHRKIRTAAEHVLDNIRGVSPRLRGEVLAVVSFVLGSTDAYVEGSFSPEVENAGRG